MVNYASSDCPFGIGKHLTIVLSVLLRRTFSNYCSDIGKPLTIVLSVLPRMTASDDLFGIFKLLAIVLTFLPRSTVSDEPFGIDKLDIHGTYYNRLNETVIHI